MAQDIITIINFIIFVFSSIIFFFLARNLYLRKEQSYLLRNMAWGIVAACIANIIVAISSIPFLIPGTGFTDAWFWGSYLYYIFVIICLGLVLSCGLAILKSKSALTYGYYSFLFIIPVTIAYGFGFVQQTPNVADMKSTLEGAILLYGFVGFQLILAVYVYLKIYLETKIRSALLMFTGMAIIFAGAVIGGIADLLIANTGRLIDPLGFITVLFGIYFVYSGFTKRGATDSQAS